MKGIINRRKILYWLYLFFIVFIGLEIFLQIFNPFHFRLKGDNILLPINQKTTIHNRINPRLDKTIINTRNSLGFRGPDTPGTFKNDLTIITVGGSTTECKFLNDSDTWSFYLGKFLEKDFQKVWVNNAGLDGHSTFGHQVLLQDHIVKIKPKMILFLIGINDIENDQPTFHDKLNNRKSFPDFKHYLYNNSEVVNLFVNAVRGWKAQRFNNTTHSLELPVQGNNLILADSIVESALKMQEKYLINYTKRIVQLIDTCRRYAIEPVFITQPNLYGEGIDSLTNANLATARLGGNINGSLMWQILQVYNMRTKEVCNRNSVNVIDLAQHMPKNSWYYYDKSHYTKEGSRKVAEIITFYLAGILQAKFPEYRLAH